VFLDFETWLLVDKLDALTYQDTAMNTYKWIHKVFPLCEIKENKPVFYSGVNSAYIGLSPSNDIPSYSFFLERSNRQELNAGIFNAFMSLYIFFNEKVLSNEPYRIQEYMLNAVYQVLRRYPKTENIQIYTQPLDVFSRFDFSDETEPTLRPFNAVRLDFDLTFNQEGCNFDFTPNPFSC
jgi:hypothetical protein